MTAFGFAALDRAPGDSISVAVEGWMHPFTADDMTYFALVDEAPCCLGCLPGEATRRIEVFARSPIPFTAGRVRLEGLGTRLTGDSAGWLYQLRDARLAGASPARPLFRRALLAAAPLLCVGIAAARAATPDQPDDAQARGAIADFATIDMHSHAGGIAGRRRVESNDGFSAVAGPMRAGGMAAICLATVSDSPTHRVMVDGRIHPFRDPEPGELYAYGQRAFARLHELARAQDIDILTDAAGLARARSGRPSLIVACEGADFLEGQPDRVAEAFARWHLRHLQLTHYRVNELGDIQTEAPVHGGLTEIGAEVIRRCNRLGIVVDVAHGTFDLVKQAAAVTTKPLVLSHTSLSGTPGPRSRLISPDHARTVAATGGVIGIWPPVSVFPTKAAMARGMARMVDLVGIDHVGLGSDMNGLVGGSIFAGYDELPALAAALLAHGFGVDETRKLLGGNYLRAFAASMA